MEREYGIIERGEVLEATQDGYIIASIDRDGIITPPLKALIGGKSFSVGEKVCYFIFKDGFGRVFDSL